MMRKLCWVFLAFCLACSTDDTAYKNYLFQYRASKNYDFLSPLETPLDSLTLLNFKGLHYYEPDKKYQVEADFTALSNTPVFGFPHTLNRTYNYREAGKIKFTLGDKPLELTAYLRDDASGDSLELFIPFTDLTNGKETYGGGRYIDVKAKATQQRIVLDFNFAYNPYCAYNKDYSCPIPPAQNNLAVAIEAGEKILNAAH